MPGVRLNFTKNGISTTIGGKGAHTTFGRGRVTNTVGVPGTGLSYTSTARARSRSSTSDAGRGSPLLGVFLLAIAAACYAGRLPIEGTIFVVFGLFFSLPLAVRIARRLSGAAAAQEAVEATARQELQALADKVRLLLFLARDDGAVRANERDLIVGYLRTQPGAEDATDAWVKEMHSKMARDPIEAIEATAGRLGEAGRIDDDFVNATAALVKLSKAVSLPQLRALSAVRQARARRPPTFTSSDKPRCPSP